jgi:hypothetical protein
MVGRTKRTHRAGTGGWIVIVRDEDLARATRAVAIGLVARSVLRPLLKWGFYLVVIAAVLFLL